VFQGSLRDFAQAIDCLEYEDCWRPIEEVSSLRALPPYFSEAIEIILLRGLQASPDVEDAAKVIAREKSRELFLRLRSQLNMRSDAIQRANLLAVLVYLKPEQPVFTSQLLDAVKQKTGIHKSTEMEQLVDYCESFCSFSPFGRTPRQHYELGKSVLIDGRTYMVRICAGKYAESLAHTSRTSLHLEATARCPFSLGVLPLMQ